MGWAYSSIFQRILCWSQSCPGYCGAQECEHWLVIPPWENKLGPGWVELFTGTVCVHPWWTSCRPAGHLGPSHLPWASCGFPGGRNGPTAKGKGNCRKYIQPQGFRKLLKSWSKCLSFIFVKTCLKSFWKVIDTNCWLFCGLKDRREGICFSAWWKLGIGQSATWG